MTNIKKYADDMCSAWNKGCAAYSRWAELYGINYYTLLVFYALDLKGKMTQKSIADYYAVPKQSIYNITRVLKKNGYIEFEESMQDKREKKIVMTEAGREYAKTFLDPLYELEQYTLNTVGRERYEQMIETMELYSVVFERGMKKYEPV